MADYIRIESINAPSSAVPGSLVEVSVTVKNLYTGIAGAYVTGRVGDVTLQFGGAQDIGQWYGAIFYDSFVMPNEDVTLEIWTWWYGAGEYHEDDTGSASIAVSTTGLTFAVSTPVAYPFSSRPDPVLITCPITVSGAPTAVTFQVKCVVYEGSGILPTPGTKLWEETKTVSFANGSHTVQFMHYSEEGTIDHRDVGVEVYYGGVKVADNVWDDVFYVTTPPEILTGLRSTSINCAFGTYDYGASIPYVLGYDYKGEAQGGKLKIELGTGLYPVFIPAAVLGEVDINFAESIDYARVTESRSFILPSSLERGQRYTVRVTLTTADELTDSDKDYNALIVLDNTIPSTDLQGLDITTTYRDYALGETLPFTLSFKYKGIAQGGTIQAIIGKGIPALFTQVHAYPPFAIQYDEASTLTTMNRDATIVLPHTLEPGQVYGLKVILTTLDDKDTTDLEGSAFRIAEGEVPTDPGVGEYREIKNHIYPYGDGYSGAASEATVDITIPLAQLPGGDWLTQQVIDRFEENVTEHGSHMLQLTVYERDEGLTSKGYRLIAVATPPDEVAGQEMTSQGIVNLAYVEPKFTPGLWAIIVLGVLVALGFIVSAVVPTVREVVWGEGGVVDTITGIGDILGNLLPMMMVVMMMGLMMEQTRDLYEPAGTPPRPKPVTEAVVKVGKGALELGKKAVPYVAEGAKKAAPYVVEAAKKAVVAAEKTVKFIAKQVQEASAAREKAAERDMEFYKSREAVKKQKLQEAKEELRRRRDEQSRL